MRFRVSIVLFALLLCSAPAFAQPTTTYRATWDENPAVDQVTGYVFYVDGVEVGRTAANVRTFNGTVTVGTHVFEVAALNAWGVSQQRAGVTQRAGFPGTPTNLRVVPPSPTADAGSGVAPGLRNGNSTPAVPTVGQPQNVRLMPIDAAPVAKPKQ